MNRRLFLQRLSTSALLLGSGVLLQASRGLAESGGATPKPFLDAATAKDWLARWEKNMLVQERNRYCDTAMGEELGWLVSPFLDGFYYGYQATRDPKWIGLLVDWTDACRKRGAKEPDGFIGWPKGDGGGKDSGDYSADSLLGEAMMLRPVVQMSAEILKTPALEVKWGGKARGYLEFAAQTFQKWDSRSAWRQLRGGGGLWVVPPFGIDRKSPGKWSSGYADRKTGGFSNPNNKENLIASWLIAMHDATGQAVYRERAEAWWRLMRSRMKTREGGKYFVWNYWEPAGAWDYDASGKTKHWVDVHPNGGYYDIDVDGIVAAFEHGLVFSRVDIDRLIATNRDFMWNKKMSSPKFQRIDGGSADIRWLDTPGVLWTSLTPYDDTLRKIFITNHNPATWGALATTPWAASRNLPAG